jgi:hypothetical protein
MADERERRKKKEERGWREGKESRRGSRYLQIYFCTRSRHLLICVRVLA